MRSTRHYYRLCTSQHDYRPLKSIRVRKSRGPSEGRDSSTHAGSSSRKPPRHERRPYGLRRLECIFWTNRRWPGASRVVPEKANFCGRFRATVGVPGVRMNIDDSRLIVRFQRLITEMLVEKRLGHRRPELTDELYQTWREVEQRGLKETPEYRDLLLRADRHALWLAGLVQLAARPVSSPEMKRTETLDAPKKAA